MTRALAAAGLAALLTLGACTSRPVLNIDNGPISASLATPPGPIIERALEERGWIVTARRPDAMDATLQVRDHRADITVGYDASGYDIVYRDSQNLHFNNGRIHTNYNKWIMLLDRDIRTALTNASVAWETPTIEGVRQAVESQRRQAERAQRSAGAAPQRP